MNTDIYVTMESWRIKVGVVVSPLPLPGAVTRGAVVTTFCPTAALSWFCSDCETGPSVPASPRGKRLFWEMSYCPIRNISPRALVSGGGLGGRNPTHHSLSHPNLEMCRLIFLHDVLVLLAGLFLPLSPVMEAKSPFSSSWLGPGCFGTVRAFWVTALRDSQGTQITSGVRFPGGECSLGEAPSLFLSSGKRTVLPCDIWYWPISLRRSLIHPTLIPQLNNQPVRSD